MNNVGGYVNIMRKQGQARSSINPNSEMSMVKLELIEHYKNNPQIAWSLINDIEKDLSVSLSEGQRMHYDAAVIAVRGYNTPQINTLSKSIPSQYNELDILKKSGWQELNKPKESILLHEKI